MSEISKKDILVSITLATYNGEKFIREQLDSLLQQTYNNLEIIISDDGSTDKTIPIIEEYFKKDPRISFSKNPTPNGYKKNFERAIRLCRGEIIFLCDQDDIWYKDKIVEHLKAYENKKNKWVSNEVRLIDEKKKNLGFMTDFFKDYYSKMSLFYQTGGRCILGCATSYRSEYLKKVPPKIQNPYILISHNSDENIDKRFEKYIDNKIIHWFAQNLLIKHPKCTPIPIGLQLRFYDKKDTTINLIKKHQKNTNRSCKIFYAFTPETNKKRAVALDKLKSNPLAIGTEKLLEREKYYESLSQYFFTASPEGGGIDCHRTWESIYLNTIPIVERNTTTEHWEEIGLPVLLIDSWSEIDLINEKTLNQRYQELKHKFNSPARYMDYWIKEIIKYKNE